MGCGSQDTSRTTELQTRKLTCKYKMDSRTITLYLPEEFDVATAQATADGRIVTFFQDDEPAGGESAVGDIWFDTNDKNKAYRYDGSTWQIARDTDIPQAITDAATAQATADGKIVTFFQNNVPTAEGAGDLWFDTDDNNKPYRATSAGDDEVKAGEWEPAPYDVSEWANILNIPSTLSGISADLGNINAGTITGVIITGGTFRTAASGKKILLNSDGLVLHVTSSVGKYSTFKYGDGTKYGSGALAYIQHESQTVPFYIAAEQSVADFHFFNRASNPTGAAEIGDVCVVMGKLKICTSAGTPGTWTVVGAQVA